MTAAAAAAGPRPDRRAAAAQAGRDAPARPRAAAHREDPAVGTGGAAAHPGRGRDQRPRRLQRPDPAEERRVPGDQDPGRVRPGRVLGPRRHLRLPGLAGMDHRRARTCAWSARPAPARATCSSPSASPPSRPGTRSATSPPPTSPRPSTAAWPTTASAGSSTPCSATTCILIDEVGFAPLDDTGAQLLFRVVAAAYERRALGIASHWPFDQWGRFLPEHTTAVSLLDRLLHHANVVVTDGDSYRMRQARAKGGTTLNKT